MADNHLIIGLGGTGGKVLAAYKRLLFENKNGETDPAKYNIDCIYVDSSAHDLLMKGPEWQIMGTDVALSPAQVFKVESPAQLAPFIQNSQSYPNLKYWIGGSEKWKEIISDITKQQAAGAQRRRLGRVNFAIKGSDFINSVNSRISLLKNRSQAAFSLKIHICVGLAGGTGSGSVVDVCALLRKTYPEYKINLYCVLPDKNPPFPIEENGYYHANGYAALLELNAMAANSFLPYDVSNKMQIYDQKIGGEEGLKDTAFNVCYLLSETNEEDYPLTPFGNEKNPIGSLIQNLSEYIFQTTIAANPNILTAINRAETNENPYDSAQSEYNFSDKFFAFGFKRFAIPEQEIKEYFAFFFNYQAILQFLYNNYNKADGYLDRSCSMSYNSIVSENSFLQKFYLTREHLMLSEDILKQYSKEIKSSITKSFTDALARITTDVKQGSTIDGRAIIKEQWLDAIEMFGNKFYDKGFRATGQDGGVSEFYERKTLDKDNLAKKIVDNLEKELFVNDWLSGNKSIDEIHEILVALNKYLANTEKQKFDDSISKNIQRISQLEQANMSIKKDWRTGFISSFFNDNEGKVRDVQKNVTEILIKKTENKALIYAKELIDSISIKLNFLITDVSTVQGYLNQIKESFQIEYSSRCVVNSESDKSSVIIKYYYPEKIREFSSLLLKEKDVLDKRITALRNSIYTIAKDSGNFFERLKKANIDEIIHLLEIESMSLTRTFFNNDKEIAKISDDKFINQNILKKLQDDYSGNDNALKEKLNSLIKQAALLSKFDSSQQIDEHAPQEQKATVIILPALKEDDESKLFNEKVIKMFKDIVSANSGIPQIETGGNQNEILILNIKRGAQARVFTTVKYLKEQYSSVMAFKGDKAKFACHIEDVEILYTKASEEKVESLKIDHRDKSILYQLFPISPEEEKRMNLNMQNDALPFLLLGKACGVVLDAEHPETGRRILCIMKKTELFDEPIILGSNLSESLNNLDNELSFLLKSQTKSMLSENFKHISTHDEIKQNIKEELNSIQILFNNNPLNPTVKRFKDAALEALNILNILN
jgi:hypothetical protein